MSSDSIDGWVIIHDRTHLHEDGETHEYLSGPFPERRMADLIRAALDCQCIKRVAPIYFPFGITMVMLMGDGAPTPEKPLAPDRLN